MTVSEYEIDLEMLENMCSEIEESAFLLNKNSDIVWMNKVLKDRMYNNYSLGELIGYDYKANPEYTRNVCSKLFGADTFSTTSTAIKVFKTGKLAKSMHTFHDMHIKKISIPIRYGSEIIYVLEIIEESPVKTETHPHAIHPDTTQKISHSISHPEIGINENSGAVSSNMVSSTSHMLKYFLEPIKDACILTDETNVLMATNKVFDDLFKDSVVLRNLLFSELQKHSRDDPTNYMNNILNLSHKISRKPVSYEGRLIGFIYLLQKRTQRKDGHRIKKLSKKTKKEKRR